MLIKKNNTVVITLKTISLKEKDLKELLPHCI